MNTMCSIFLSPGIKHEYRLETSLSQDLFVKFTGRCNPFVLTQGRWSTGCQKRAWKIVWAPIPFFPAVPSAETAGGTHTSYTSSNRHLLPFPFLDADSLLISMRRVLTIHGAKDEIVPAEDARRFAANVPNHRRGQPPVRRARAGADLARAGLRQAPSPEHVALASETVERCETIRERTWWNSLVPIRIEMALSGLEGC